MSTKNEKRTPEEAWDALERMGVDDEVDRALALDDAALDEELRAAGADPAAVRARGEALGRELDAKRAETKAALGGDGPRRAEEPARRGLRARWVLWAGGAVAAAAAAWALFVQPANVNVGSPPPPEVLAARAREAGLADCAKQDFDACRRKLDEAKELDPEGEHDPRVVKAREDIARAGKSAP